MLYKKTLLTSTLIALVVALALMLVPAGTALAGVGTDTGGAVAVATAPDGVPSHAAVKKFLDSACTIQDTSDVTHVIDIANDPVNALGGSSSGQNPQALAMTAKATAGNGQVFWYWSVAGNSAARLSTDPTICVGFPQNGTATYYAVYRSPTKTGALTMGYWQSKDGRGIIAGQAEARTCPSATWLSQLAPFQDLGATATCPQVATYVDKVIRAANASGASMNAMLKGQMLATSLNIYFSDPALGGNKINAPAPIGGVTIDLTLVCTMIDGAGGSATCGGVYQNTAAAFGSANSLSVSHILAHAAAQSNAGGFQELAKNTFEAINNQVAFAP